MIAHEPNIPALLDLEQSTPGAGPDALLLCKDKALAKVPAYHRVHSPNFVVSHHAHPLRHLARFNYPAFVKPVGEESSDGISKASFARDETEALERMRYIHQKFNCDVLIEEYIEGRELYLSVLGNDSPHGFPHSARSSSRCLKIFPSSPPTMPSEREQCQKGTAQRICQPQTVCLNTSRSSPRRSYRLLKIRGFGRIDVRLFAQRDVFA